ncbi:MAG: hypothetical protein U0Q22_04605 [Acidimicrobiales bacterium]
MLLRPLHRLPSQPQLTQMLRGLLGREVELTKIEPHDHPSYVAIYSDATGRAVNVLAFDVPLAASASAALALIPVGSAEEWIASGELPEDARDNVYEVLNVLAATHNQNDESRHVKLTSLVSPGDALPDDVARGLASPAAFVWFRAEVPGFPGGILNAAAF